MSGDRRLKLVARTAVANFRDSRMIISRQGWRPQQQPATPTPAERIEALQRTITILVADRLYLAKLLASYAVELSGQVERGAA